MEQWRWMEGILWELWLLSHAQEDLTELDQVSGDVRLQDHGHNPPQHATKVNDEIRKFYPLTSFKILGYYQI